MEIECEVAKRARQLESLEEYRVKQKEQGDEIRRLEMEVVDKKIEHSIKIEKMKAEYLEDKVNFQKMADSRVNAMQQKANEEALQCLSHNTKRVKLENKNLRAELLGLIQKTRTLLEYKDQLERQNRELQREKQLSEDMKRLRLTRQHRALSRAVARGDESDDDYNI
eukprot:Colp12_sorted_trinity150504_noHs@27361